MFNRLRNTRGFTLIELMIVVAILGILAAVAVPAFLKYIRDSKTAEAQENLKSIGDGAITYYQEEHPNAAGDVVTTQVYPTTTGCSAGNVDGQKVDSGTTAWNDITLPFKDLRFQLSKPHYYKYCYVPVTAGIGFVATATASLSAASDSEYTLTGSETVDGPKLGAIVEVK